MSSLFEWLVSLDPGPWAFGIAALAVTAFVVVAVTRMYWKFHDREAERRSQERFERMRRDRESELLKEMRESWRVRDEFVRYVLEQEKAGRSREDADAEEGDSQG